jgi:hypothetical protein
MVLDDGPDRPTLARWMAGAVAAHPLLPLLTDKAPHATDILNGFEVLLKSVEGADPSRWMSKRQVFKNIPFDSQLLAMRAEFVVAAMMATADVAFDLGNEDLPNPDFVLASGLGIEVTSKNPEGVKDLIETLEDCLQGFANCSVGLSFSHYPNRLQTEVRAAIVNEIVAEVRKVAEALPGMQAGHVVSGTIQDSKNGTPIEWQATVYPVARILGQRVTWETHSGVLADSLDAILTELLYILEDPRKLKQAESMPTVLMVDIGRIGGGWMRPPKVWAQVLESRLPLSSPFVGLAVFAPSLDRTDADLALAVSSEASSVVREQIESFCIAIGLESVAPRAWAPQISPTAEELG